MKIKVKPGHEAMTKSNFEKRETRQVYNLFQDLCNKFLGFIQEV